MKGPVGCLRGLIVIHNRPRSTSGLRTASDFNEAKHTELRTTNWFHVMLVVGRTLSSASAQHAPSSIRS